MFGYIKPMTSELKVRENELYKALYCGLCESIGENISQAGRFALSYDMLFLVLCRCDITGEEIHIEKSRCIAHPIKKRNHASTPDTLKYAAKVSAILTCYNIFDDIEDTGKLKYRMLKPFANSLNRKANSDVLKEIVKTHIEKLGEYEKDNAGLDRVAEIFGKMLGEIFSLDIADTKNKYEAYNIGYHVGKWIYILDACDDYEKDKKDGTFNPLLRFDILPTEMLKTTLTLELAEANNALDRLNSNNEAIHSIIKNIINLGMPQVQDKVFEEKNK